MARKSEYQTMAETLLAAKGAEALAVARRRYYASRRRNDAAGCQTWLRVADAIRLASQAAAPAADPPPPEPSRGRAIAS
jgi:hypothetical protein